MTVLIAQIVGQVGAMLLVAFLAYRLGRYMERYDAIHAAVDVANKIGQAITDIREHLVDVDRGWLRQGRKDPSTTANDTDRTSGDAKP